MIKIDLKPLSVNEAWKGKRFRTDKYRKFQTDLSYLLPKIEITNPPFCLKLVFGFSNKLSDIDNPVKLVQDILVKKYGFDDRDIYRLEVDKTIVKKGSEFIRFEILPI